MYYGAYNTHADLDRHNHGFSNTWVVVRFDSKEAREEFLAALDNKKAKACTRREAEWVWKDNYLTAGKPVPKGGLFDDGYYGEGFRGCDWSELKADLFEDDQWWEDQADQETRYREEEEKIWASYEAWNAEREAEYQKEVEAERRIIEEGEAARREYLAA